MPLQLIAPPALEPVTLAEAKAHLKLDTDADDALVTRLIGAARARAEWHTGRALVTQSWIQWLDCWSPLVELMLPPLIAVTSVTTYDGEDNSTTVEASRYFVDTVSGRIAFDCLAPAMLRRRNAVAIAFDAGYGDTAEDVPAGIRAAILSIVADLYAHRGDGPAEPSDVAQALLAPYRIFKL